MQQQHEFITMDGKKQGIYELFMGDNNTRLIAQHVKNTGNIRQTMEKFANELELKNGGGESMQNDITESIAFLNQLYLNEYGVETQETHQVSTGGKYPKVKLQNSFNYNDVYSFREYDAQRDQKTMSDTTRYRYNNKLPQWNQAGHRQRHQTENTGLRLGSFQEKESINRGYAMETILAENRYNTKPSYNFDQMLAHTDRLQ